jgi:hypothetical protein
MAAQGPTEAEGEKGAPSEDLKGLRGLKRAGIQVFILFHVIAFACCCLPIQSLLVTNVKERTTPYLAAFGLFQNWDMFAPDPLRLNIRVEAMITFLNGETRIWKFPQMHELGYVDRYFRERYRKYATEYLRVDAYAGLRPDAARYVARLHNQPSNPPVTVEFFRSWSEMKPMRPDGLYQEDAWTKVSFFTYKVSAGDLR